MDFTREILCGTLNYKHLHVLFTLQVALFRIVWAVGIGDFFNVESVKIHRKDRRCLGQNLVYRRNHHSTCSIATRKLSANSMDYFCCEPFGGSEPCVSLVGAMTQLTAALMRPVREAFETF